MSEVTAEKIVLGKIYPVDGSRGFCEAMAVKDGKIPLSRHRSYVRLFEELKELKEWQQWLTLRPKRR